MFRQIAVPGFVLALALTACSGAGDEAGGDWAGTVTDSAGIEIVASPTTPLWAEGDGWTVEEALRIGKPAGEPEYQFGLISGIGMTSGGEVLVMDQQGQELKVFGPDGTWVRTIGDAGSGPGQFGPQAGPVLVGRGDTVLVPDLGNQRVNLLSPDGDQLGSFRLGLERGIPIRWEMTPDGTPVTQLRSLNLPGQAGGQADTMDAIVERAYDGTVTDTVLRVPSGKTFSFASGTPEFHFFSPEPMWALTRDGGIVLGVNDAMSFRVFGPDGALRRIVRMPFEPKPVTEEDKSIFLDTLERLWGQAGVPGEAIAQLKQAVSFEARFPAYVQALAGPGGSLWVQRILRPSDLSAEEKEDFNPLQNMGSPDWDVFDGEGRYLGVVGMPFHFQPLGFSGDDVYGVWRDELDVQYAMVLRIVGIE
jgi:hypothetical protein